MLNKYIDKKDGDKKIGISSKTKEKETSSIKTPKKQREFSPSLSSQKNVNNNNSKPQTPSLMGKEKFF